MPREIDPFDRSACLLGYAESALERAESDLRNGRDPRGVQQQLESTIASIKDYQQMPLDEFGRRFGLIKETAPVGATTEAAA